MKTNFINLIGIELEGGWGDLPKAYWEGIHSTIKTDGSLSGLGTYYTREIISPPLKSDKIEDWVKNYCPEEVNDTCGLHIHMSMPEKYYVLLMENRFWKWFQSELEILADKTYIDPESDEYCAFNERFQGQNQYCRKKFIPDEQVRPGVAVDRYTQINFRAYLRHKTVEFRVLPATSNKEIACKSIMGVVRLVDNYLAAASQLVQPSKKLLLREIDINGEKDIICV